MPENEQLHAREAALVDGCMAQCVAFDQTPDVTAPTARVEHCDSDSIGIDSSSLNTCTTDHCAPLESNDETTEAALTVDSVKPLRAGVRTCLRSKWEHRQRLRLSVGGHGADRQSEVQNGDNPQLCASGRLAPEGPLRTAESRSWCNKHPAVWKVAGAACLLVFLRLAWMASSMHFRSTRKDQTAFDVHASIAALHDANCALIQRIDGKLYVTKRHISLLWQPSSMRHVVTETLIETPSAWIVDAWKPDGATGVLPVVDILSDTQLDYDTKSFADLRRLNNHMLPLATKYKLFGETAAAKGHVLPIMRNFQAIHQALEQVWASLADDTSQLAAVTHEIAAINKNVAALIARHRLVTEYAHVASLVSVLTRQAGDAVAVEAACSALRNLAVNADNLLPFQQAGVIPPLVAAMTRHADSAAVLEQACGVLRNLAMIADIQVDIVRAGGIPPLVTALTRHVDSVAILQSACGLLRNLAVNADNTVAIARAGGIPYLVAAMTRHVDRSDILQIASAVLQNLAVNDGNKVAIARASGIPFMVATMTRHADNAAVMASACAVLRNLASNADNMVAIARAGGIPRLVATMTRHVGNAAVMEHACAVLWNLATNNDNKRVLIGLGARRLLQGVLDRWPATPAYTNAQGALNVLK